MTYDEGIMEERKRIIKIIEDYFPKLEDPEKNHLSYLGKQTLKNLLREITK